MDISGDMKHLQKERERERERDAYTHRPTHIVEPRVKLDHRAAKVSVLTTKSTLAKANHTHNWITRLPTGHPLAVCQ